MNSNFRKSAIVFLREASHGKNMVLDAEISPGKVVDVLFPGINCVVVLHFVGENHRDMINWQNSDGVKVVHLWEDQWVFCREKITSKISSLLGNTQKIHGRQTKLAAIDNARLMDFLAINHLNVPIKARYKYGLFHENELVAVMSFSKGRKIMRGRVPYNSFELLRFCSKLDTTVVGGFSKLLNHFIKTQNPDDIMTYIDGDWSDGQSLLKFGFESMGEMPPMFFWLDTKTGVREYPRIVLKKHEISMDDISNPIDKKAFLYLHGFKEVYNSGGHKYLLRRK